MPLLPFGLPPRQTTVSTPCSASQIEKETNTSFRLSLISKILSILYSKVFDPSLTNEESHGGVTSYVNVTYVLLDVILPGIENCSFLIQTHFDIDVVMISSSGTRKVFTQTRLLISDEIARCCGWPKSEHFNVFHRSEPKLPA